MGRRERKRVKKKKDAGQKEETWVIFQEIGQCRGEGTGQRERKKDKKPHLAKRSERGRGWVGKRRALRGKTNRCREKQNDQMLTGWQHGKRGE